MCRCVRFFFKQKTAYEVRISDWSSDVCSSDLPSGPAQSGNRSAPMVCFSMSNGRQKSGLCNTSMQLMKPFGRLTRRRSEAHTSELQSLMRISYSVFCLKKKIARLNIHIKEQ